MEPGRLALDFEKGGVRSVAISADDSDRTVKMAEKVKASLVSFAFDLSLSVARA